MDGRGIRVAMAMVAMALLHGCGGSGPSDGEEAGAATASRSTTTAAAPTPTTTPPTFRTDVGVEAPPDAIAVTMDEWKFNPSTLRTGTSFKVALRNDEAPCAGPTCDPNFDVHDFQILDPDTALAFARSARLETGQSGVFVVEGLQPGTYRFICSLHSLASMNGTIEVAA